MPFVPEGNHVWLSYEHIPVVSPPGLSYNPGFEGHVQIVKRIRAVIIKNGMIVL
jgi:hypothetical protein